VKEKLSLDLAAAAIILGIASLWLLPRLPSRAEYGLVLLSASILLFIAGKPATFVALFLFGFLWGSYTAQSQLNLTYRYSGRQINIIGRVINVASDELGHHRLVVKVNCADEHQTAMLHPLFMILNWSSATPPVKAGQKWRLNVSVRPVHGMLNEGGFNRQRRAMALRQTLMGYVKQGTLLSEKIGVRQQLIEKSKRAVANLNNQGILLALAFGERSGLSSEQNALLLKTGTAHLMAISGLHISLAALLGFWLARLLQGLLPARLIGLQMPYSVGWLFAVVYTWLSGANPPALRAVLALTAWMFLRYRSLIFSPWQVWLLIIAALLIYDPLSVLSDSLWLSCGAVAGLIFWFQWAPLSRRFQRKRWFLLRWIHLQLSMCLLLLPLQTAVFQGASLWSLPANLVAVPIVSFITVPTILAALILADFYIVADVLWRIADASVALVFNALSHLQSGWFTLSNAVLPLSFTGWLGVIVWRLGLWRYCYMACLAAVALTVQFGGNKNYLWRLDMLDVGHGLALVIHDGKSALVYDTGNRWQNGTAAESVIIPFLKRHGLNLEGIIVSHSDSDHIGGLIALRRSYPQAWLRTSTLSGDLPCIAGESWRWRNLHFEVIWPKKLSVRATNADSCVVRLSDGRHRVLLTGDLEKPQELALVKGHAEQLSADILQTPHHGSKTSSSGPFLRSVSPQATLTSISRYNPWRLPSAKVRDSYQKMAVAWYSTASSGQISVLFFKDKYEIRRFRQDLSPRWYNQWFGDMPEND
jgi:competence protein ComEC